MASVSLELIQAEEEPEETTFVQRPSTTLAMRQRLRPPPKSANPGPPAWLLVKLRMLVLADSQTG